MKEQNIVIDAIETAIHQMENIKINLPNYNRHNVANIVDSFVDEYTDNWQIFDDYCTLYLRSAASAQTVTITWK